MTFLGFSNHPIMWFQSYFSDRSFRVNIKSKYSITAKIECGLPQGSILGSLLFLLYGNDMKHAANCDLFLNIDDSCLFINIMISVKLSKVSTKFFRTFATGLLVLN